jgi:phenylpropionate dioxygenase-like ring-hydroxylating dioxygenase large terminal subunit
VCAADAYCPHLGAHLGRGGVVEGENIRCPFHGFQFNCDGACVATGYGTTPPKDATLHLWPVAERNGFVLVWYHPEAAAPSFDIPELGGEGWTPWEIRRWDLAGHPQETTENSVDIGHLTIIHGYTGVDQLRPLNTDGPCLSARYVMHRDAGLFGRGGKLRAEFDIAAWGLGYSMVEVEVAQFGLKTRQAVLCTPTDDGRAHLMIAMSLNLPAKRSRVNPFLGLMPRSWAGLVASKAAIRAFAHDVSQDFDIWQNKIYVDRPVLAVGDGPVVRYRRWAKQFYLKPTAVGGAEAADG